MPAVVYFLVLYLFRTCLASDNEAEVSSVVKSSYDRLDVPGEHLQLYLNAFSENATNLRWGYEVDSTGRDIIRYSQPKCPGSHVGYVKDKVSQFNAFFTQADFGYVRQQLFELRVLCEPDFVHDSSLECSKNLRYCNGRNLFIDLRDIPDRKEPIRYHTDVLKEGQIGGFCRLHQEQLKKELDHLSALQSWAPEMRNFESVGHRPFADDGELCDVYVDRPTIVMKLDASVNMYHHFCDFFNLYASLHINATANPKMYDRDVNILIWETHQYRSAFEQTFTAFTEHPLMDLTTFEGKRVCFRNLMFPLLPRMIFGLFYNTPIVHGCHSSGLFRAFSEFILHRLRIPFHSIPPEDEIRPLVRITFLSRKTKFRNVLNEEELIAAIREMRGVEVRRVAFTKELTFKQQLEISRNTDVFIGMHGAGLTHLLFLPDWATVFELYNCGDAGCYKDLARLRGVSYLTWQNSTKVFPQDEGTHPDGNGAHAKFTNYKFEVREFVRLVRKAVKRVRDNDKYQRFAGIKGDDEVCGRDEKEQAEAETQINVVQLQEA